MTLAGDTAVAEKSSIRTRRTLVWFIYLASFALIAWLFADGYSYYMTPYLQRRIIRGMPCSARPVLEV